MKAIWNGAVIAECDNTVVVEGNHYFPAASVTQSYLRASAKTTVCGWKGIANYHTIIVDGEKNPDAAWYYADPKSAAENIKDHVAFWRGVEIVA
ncbi:MAG: DUF427 domain-containing protein [Proteobacteria bacterium]|nr:DUF427 domain-containing protein [Pseudomonadota bacterium]